MFSKYTAITKAQIDRRNYWVKEIEKLSGRFTDDFDRLRDELRQEVKALKTDSLLSHLRLCGAIPERYGHDSSEEKLYSKYTAMKQLDQIHISSAKELLKGLGPESIHALISDIPYGIGAEDWDVLHNNTNSALLGTSPAQQKAGAVFKNRGKPLNGWSEADRAIPKEYYEWCMAWVPEAKRVLKPGRSVAVELLRLRLGILIDISSLGTYPQNSARSPGTDFNQIYSQHH